MARDVEALVLMMDANIARFEKVWIGVEKGPR